MKRSTSKPRLSSRHFTRDEIVVRLIEQGVPRHKAEATADQQVVSSLRSEERPRPKPPRNRKGGKKELSFDQKRFRVYCQVEGLPLPICDHPFLSHLPKPQRRMLELDYAWVEEKVAIEVQGGIFRKGGGAHTGAGHLRDMEKLTLAQQHGWFVHQCVPDKLCTPATLEIIRQALTQRSAA